MRSIVLDGPAKINLYLDVLSRRTDGYHNIATIFQKLKLCDKLKISVIKKGISLSCKYPCVPSGQSNLAYKAACLMLKEFNLSCGLDISIKKNIPVAAGLGGGSSDAASVIVAVNRLFKLHLSAKQLMPLGKRIGADVPFFISGYSCAVGRGIGDRLKELKHNRIFYVLLLLPYKIRIYTKSIYNRISFPLTKPIAGVNMIARILSDNKKSGSGILAESFYNRLEDVVFPIYPIVKKGREILSSYGDGALLSGSGPAIFALFDTRKEAMRVRNRLKRDGRWQLFLTETS